MKIFILGGSGILSTDFTQIALDYKDDVYLLNRGLRKSFINSKAKLIISDIRTETVEQIRKKIEGLYFDVVIDFLSFEVEQMKKALQIIEGHFKQYIFISSATVYKEQCEGSLLTENCEVGNDKWDYAYKKYLCEEFLQNTAVNFTIIRPYVTFGKSRIPFPIIPDGFHYTLIKRIKEEKPILLYDEGRAICTLTHTRDFAEVLYRLLLNEKAYKEIFHITGQNVQSWRSVYGCLCQILGKRENYVSLDENDVKIYMPEIHDMLIGDKGKDMRFNNTKVLKAIGGYDFKVDLESGLKESLEYYENNAFMQGVNYGWDGKCDCVVSKMTGQRLRPLSNCNETYSTRQCMYYVYKHKALYEVYGLAKRLVG